MRSFRNTLLIGTVSLTLAACGGGSDTPVSFDTPPTVTVQSEYDKQTNAAREQFETRLATALAEADRWMDNNRREADVVTTQSGLQYRIEKSSPNPTGKKYLVQGWQEALELMQPGDEWTLFIPPSLGYGEAGKGGGVPANAALIFKVQLR